MDTSRQVPVENTAKGELATAVQRQQRSIAEKRRIVEETLAEGASVARIARAHGVNANQVFGWRRLYLSGRLGEQKATMKLLPVRVSEGLPSVKPHASNEGTTSIEVANPKPVPGTIDVKLRQAQLRIEGSADPELVRVLLEYLAR
jgi:transposase